ncbi:MAG: hypothetical protein R6V05_15350, partial [Candidatus Brocadiia bacterium]
FHQVTDCAADAASGTRTYAVAVGRGRARRHLRVASAVASAWLLFTLAWVAFSVPGWGLAAGATGGAAALAAGAYAAVKRRRAGRASALIRELPGTYLGLTYAVFRVVPLVLLARLALLRATMWSVFALAGLLMLTESWHSLRYRHG